MRFGSGGQFGGGVDTGHTVEDRCTVLDSPQDQFGDSGGAPVCFQRQTQFLKPAPGRGRGSSPPGFPFDSRHTSIRGSILNFLLDRSTYPAIASEDRGRQNKSSD
jgi:hypothetical protein